MMSCKRLLLWILLPVISAQQQAGQSVDSNLVDQLFEMPVEELLAVKIITAGKKEQNILEIPASTVVISREEIQRYGYGSLSEILENVLGLYMIDNKTFHYKTVGVRGHWTQLSRNVLVLINGVNQREEFHADYPNSWALPVEAIDKVEIVRGPMSVMYGSGAFFGVVNIITHDVNQDILYSNASLTYGSNSTIKAQLRVAKKLGEASFAFNGSILDTDGVNFDYDELTTQQDKFPEWGVDSKSTEGRYAQKLQYFDLSLKYKDWRFEVNNKSVIRGFSYIQPHPGDDPNVKQNMSNAYISFRKNFSEKFAMDYHATFSAAFSKYHLVWGAHKSPYPYSESVSRFIELDANHFYSPTDKVELSLGFNYHLTQKNEQSGDFASLNNYLLKYDDAVPSVTSLFAQAHLQLTPKLRFVGGGRVEYYSDHDILYYFNQGLADTTGALLDGLWQEQVDKKSFQFIPSVSVIYAFNNKHVLKLMYGQALMQPDILSNFDVMRTIYEYQLEGDWLRPEKILTYELNYQALIELANRKDQLALSVSLFRNELESLFKRKEEIINNEFVTRSSNSGEKTTHGIESAIEYKKTDRFIAYVGYSFQHSEDKTSKLDVSFSPAHLFYLKLQYRFMKSGYFSIYGNYVSKMQSVWDNSPAPDSPTNDPESPDYLPVGRLGGESGDYFKVSANLRIEDLFLEGFYFSVKINNVFDKDIRMPTDAASIWADKGMKAPGRAFNIGIGYAF